VPRPRETCNRADLMRAVLLENLDAIGAAECDADMRATALRAAGWTVHAAVVGQTPAAADSLCLVTRARLTRFTRDAAGRQGVRELVAHVRPDAVFVASGAPGGGDIAEWLPVGSPAWWWPTAFLPGSPRGGVLEPLGPESAHDPTAWSVGTLPRTGRGMLALWDGDFVMSPGPLSGDAGRLALEAFAALDDSWSGVEFVVLAHPQPEFEAHARALGIGPRLHFAGPAPREAEHSWLLSTSAVLIAGDEPLAGGVVLRALASGAPLLTIGSDGVPGRVCSTLTRLGCAPPVANDEASATLALADALERTDVAEHRSVAGREAAGAFSLSALTNYLGSVITPRRQARAA